MDGIKLSLPKNYSRLGVEKQILAVMDELESLGFDRDRALSGPELAFRALYSFNAKTVVQVFGLVQILADNQPLPVRGAMYRGVGKLWPDTSDPSYRKCNRLILEMRRKGLVPYSWITDGSRAWDKPSSWSGLADYAEAVGDSYRKNLWERQTDYIEVLVEKDAMSGIIRPVTREYDVRLSPLRGNASETFLWSIAEDWKEIEKPIFVYYLGDHDPSGLRIEKDARRRLEAFCGRRVNWERLAITSDDFANSQLLGFPVKRKEAAAKWRPYLEEFGDRCVEVDAIPAPEIRERVRSAIESHIDQSEWEALKRTEELERASVLELVRAIGN
jgi:hypothetical protein